jgi:hypothetical protein
LNDESLEFLRCLPKRQPSLLMREHALNASPVTRHIAAMGALNFSKTRGRIAALKRPLLPCIAALRECRFEKKMPAHQPSRQ